ncbi:N-(5'-phosphoribosyl)anthranilate isomerase [Arsenicibacter rosenii]|uniref:phosphoribosylanthranilate isomerase n=1 Tax=Arsenicibacter rosenii TaxID=1750698 RepID=A0A1S2VQQ4_9BACT|nr:N-(5'-phosphoribosyl)anthranilate isomerase [Arsenicibacter rosenii]OIN61109.1 N-(5'-phosphoribosyl)anthranilate isomerase [Arsenicibacter rosenii]
MALKTIVKISNVTNLSDARYCAGMGVDMLGFSMDEQSPEYVDPKKLAEIRSWVAGVQIVGETTSTDLTQLEQLLELYQPDILQINESALLPYVSSFGKPVILSLDLSLLSLEQLDALATTPLAGADFVLLESRAALHLDADLSAQINQLAARHPVLLGTGFSADSINGLLSTLPVQGIALQGGDEERPGNKEFGALMDILEVLETED